MNFYKVHDRLNTWLPTVIVALLLLPLNTAATFHSGLDSPLGWINLFFVILWVSILAFQFTHMPRTTKSSKAVKFD